MILGGFELSVSPAWRGLTFFERRIKCRRRFGLLPRYLNATPNILLKIFIKKYLNFLQTLFLEMSCVFPVKNNLNSPEGCLALK